MNKTKTIFFIDFIGALSFLVVAITGFWRWFFIPEGGMGRGVSAEIINLRQNLKVWHDYTALILTVTVIIHIIMHRKWIIYTLKSFRNNKNKIGNP